MKSRTLLIALIFVGSISTLNPAFAEDQNQIKLRLGSPTPLHFFGNSLRDSSKPTDVFGIVPPCNSSIESNYRSLPCIRSVHYRKLGSTAWSDTKLISTDLSPYVETETVKGGFKPELSEDRFTDNWWYLNGGSSSLWQGSFADGESKEFDLNFIVEATVASRVLPKTFSLSLVPVEASNDFTTDLSDIRKSTLRRLPFPENYEFQVVMKQSSAMQPLQFVTSRTKDASVVNTAGPNVSLPEFIFRGTPTPHSVLESKKLSCSDPLLVKTLGTQCTSISGDHWKIFPWDRAILDLLNDSIIDSFDEVSTLTEWSFQGGQDSSLIFDLINGCGYSNIFSVTSTNAPAYHINPPRWNQEDSSLSVKIANSHFNSLAQVQRGFFSIQLRLSSAACMWGIERKNINAKVELISENGQIQNISTSSINIDEAMDKVVITLSGFSYSSPTVKIQLSGTPISPVISAVKDYGNKRVICVKGKKRIELPKLRSKCPSGFKRL